MRLAGWAGIVFVVLSLVIVVLSPFWPPLGGSASDVAAYYRAHRLPFLIGNYLAVLAAVPSFLQIAGLVWLVKNAEGSGGWRWLTLLGSALLAHAVGALALAAYQVVPFELAPGQEAVAKGFSDFAGVAFGLFLVIVAGFVALTAWAVYETRVLPRWFAHLSVLMAVACFAASAGAIVDEPRWLAGGGLASAVSTSVFFIWCLALSVLFLRGNHAAVGVR